MPLQSKGRAAALDEHGRQAGRAQGTHLPIIQITLCVYNSAVMVCMEKLERNAG